jgi:hypothetical protein
MRKTIFLSLLSFLAVSCHEEVILPVGDDRPVGVMNALLNTLDTTHTVLLSVARKSQMLPLERADVHVFVNGTLAATAEEMCGMVQYDPEKEVGYSFNAAFQPGDEVRIEARKDDISMTATVTAPQPATLLSADTVYVQVNYLGVTEWTIQVKTVFQDLPGASYYRVTGRILDEFEYQDMEKNPIPGYSGAVEDTLWIDSGFDPVISEGAGKTSADLGTLLEKGHTYHCFSDLSFAGQECTIRFLIDPIRIGVFYPERYMTDTMSEDLSTLAYNYYRIVRRRAFVQLRTLDFSQYRYLKALEKLESYGKELSFLVEPAALPSNVEGGQGFVGIETVSEIVFYKNGYMAIPYGLFYRDE